MNGKWEPFCRTASTYYAHCTVIDKAMGLWILHYRDIDTIIKKEDDNMEEHTSKKEDDNIEKCTSENKNDNNDIDDNNNKNKKKKKK